MGTKRNFYLNNVLVEPPDNQEATTIKFSYDKDSVIENGNRELAITDFEWVRDNMDIIQKHFQDGRIFEGIPLRYELEKGGVKEVAFDGYLDLTESPQLSHCKKNIIKAKERAKIDWLNDVADSVSFEYLYSIGKIKQSDFVYMPYVISTVPNYREAFMVAVSVAIISLQIGEQTTALGQLLSQSAQPFGFVVIAAAIVRIAFIITLIVTLIKLIDDLANLIIQPVKYHACMRALDLLKIGAEHFGYELKADDLETTYKDLVILPEKNQIPVNSLDSRILGFTGIDKLLQKGFPSDTFGGFLRKMKGIFKSKVVINDNQLIFIRQDKQTGTPQYQLPDLYQPFFTTNADELKSNYLIQFQTDLNDKNTILEYKGTAYQVITTQKGTLSDPKLNLIKGLETASIPYALAKVKTDLTTPEKILDSFISGYAAIMNGLISVAKGIVKVFAAIARAINKVFKVLKAISFGKIRLHVDVPNADNIKYVDIEKISNRIGMMKLENDFVTTPKMFLIKGGASESKNKIHPDNSVKLSGKYLWENYHRYSVSFLPSDERPNGNQYLIREFEKIHFTFPDFQKVKTNNKIFDVDGKEAEIVSGEWNDFEDVAKMKVRISYLYTDKLQETYLEPTGT